METFNTYILGASKIIDSKYVLVYNTKSFLDKSDHFSLGKNKLSGSKQLSLLSSDPTKSNIHKILDSLFILRDDSGNLIYKPIKSSVVIDAEKLNQGYVTEFIVNNERDNIVCSDGFNVIIYLYEDANNKLIPLGFSIFLEPQGKRVRTTSDQFIIKKDYFVKNLHIYIGFKDTLLIDQVKVNLVDSLVDPERPDQSGDNNWNYTNIEKWKKTRLNIGRNFYSSRVYSTEQLNKEVFTDSSSFLVDKKNKVKGTKLTINQNLQIQDYHDKKFNKFQIGFFNGDLVLNTWNDENEYIIYSLTKKNLVGNVMTYTVPVKNDLVNFRTNVYKLPELVGHTSKIEFISGNYISVHHKNSTTGEEFNSIFDIDTQSSSNDSDNPGWKILKNNKVLLDPLDVRIRIIKTDRLIFSSLDNAKKQIPSISDIYFDTRKVELDHKIEILGKRGEWFILKYPPYDLIVITNMTKQIVIRPVELSNVIFVNNQVLIIKEQYKEIPNQTTYTLFDDDGKLTTTSTREYVDTYINRNLLSSYKDYSNSKIHNITINNGINSSDDILKIQRSFLAYFRRNVLPTSFTDFEIIGGIGGLIFYRQGSYINYL